MDRKSALEACLRFYDNGRKCPLNHEPSVRYSITGKCLECCKLERVRLKEQRREESATRAKEAIPKAIDATRKQAKAAGLLFYDNGKRCPEGHESTVRYTITGKCRECCKSETPRYREKRAIYAAANLAKIVANVAVWKKANPVRVKELAAGYRERNREDLRAKNVIYRKENPTDPALRVVREARRRTLKLGCGGSFTKADVARILRNQGGKCAYCRKSLKSGHSVDHIIPLVLKGSSNPSNLQLLCKSCNSSKGPKHPIDFARTRGLLL